MSRQPGTELYVLYQRRIRVEGTTPYVSGIPRSSISSFSPSQAWDEVLKLKFDRFASNAHMKYFADNRTKILATQCDIKTQLYKQLDFLNENLYPFWTTRYRKNSGRQAGIIEDGQLRGYMSPEESVQHCFEVGLSGYNSGTPWFDGYNGQKGSSSRNSRRLRCTTVNVSTFWSLCVHVTSILHLLKVEPRLVRGQK